MMRGRAVPAPYGMKCCVRHALDRGGDSLSPQDLFQTASISFGGR